MDVFRKNNVIACRKILIGLISLIVPFLIIASMFERAGGGTQRTKDWILPAVVFVAVAIYVVYQRIVDKRAERKSHFLLRMADVLVLLSAAVITLFSIYAMVSWSFELTSFLIQIGVLIVSVIPLVDTLRD